MSLAASIGRGLASRRTRVRNDSPVPLSSSLRVAMPTLGMRGNVESQLSAMGTVGTLFAVINRITTGVAGVEWHLYRKSATGSNEDREEVTRHAAIDLWNKPNNFYTGQEFVETFQQHVDLAGESWWVVSRSERAPSLPLELWPVRPDRMTPKVDPYKFIVGYEYTSPDGQKIHLELNEVIQLKMPNPMNPYRGLGPVQAMLVDIDSARYSAEWNRNFFINSAEPGGIIEVDKRLSDGEFDEFRNRWAEQHKGVANAHRVALLEQGKWVERNYTMRDMQFTELRRLSRDVILEGFGFPKPMIGAVDDVNRANAEAAEYVFARWIVVPRLDRIKGVLNNDFLPLFGSTTKGLEWDYTSPVPDDERLHNEQIKTQVEAFKTLMDAGVDADSAAVIVGLPPMTMAVGTGAAIGAVTSAANSSANDSLPVQASSNGYAYRHGPGRNSTNGHKRIHAGALR